MPFIKRCYQSFETIVTEVNMKKILAALLSVMMVLGLFGCAAKEEPVPEKTSFKASYMDYFDTLSTIVGYAETQEEFDAVCEVIKKELEELETLLENLAH